MLPCSLTAVDPSIVFWLVKASKKKRLKMSNKNTFIPDNDDERTPPEIVEEARKVSENLLPSKSKEKYMNTYTKFMEWKTEKKVNSLSEIVLLAYFSELAEKLKPSSLWATYSMLRSTISCNNNVNIYNYSKLIAFLKRQSRGFQSKNQKF